jgi:hypothetical protein
MIYNLMEELRTMAEDHDDELCREALSYIEQLQLTLWEINKRLNDKDSWLAQSIDCRNIAEAALREKKDGN